MERPNLHDLTYERLEALLVSWGQSPAHARPTWLALYRELITGAEQVTGLPDALVRQLVTRTILTVPRRLTLIEAPDGATRKDLLELADGETVEVVLLRYRQRRSACISTQVGCACGCTFCATGQMGFVRQLQPGEIVAQVLHVQRTMVVVGEQLTNLVLMGMGEPLLNYDNTLTALQILLDKRGLGLPPRRVTLSTVGIVPGILRLAEEDLGINLAVSLHAATDALRTRLMPINARHPLDALFAALMLYTERTGRRVMFEWVLVDGVTDTPEQAAALVERLRGFPAHVNLILLNPTGDYTARPSPPGAVEAFTAALDHAGIPHTMRQRRGNVIAAGCGQLRQRQNDL
ncbi:MAG: 23S rRNA (adenine(2503)-C(2))-methyltransferase RlmN [Anaerolineae bacterium]|nr:23S rRNA (adenine(2503)-C(2))-methyltransferase RlmN [Anaerolineae bacterium]